MLFMATLIIIEKKTETIHKSFNWWIDKYNLVYLYNGIVFNNKKEQTWYHSNIPQIFYVKWEETDAKDYLLDSCNYIKCP